MRKVVGFLVTVLIVLVSYQQPTHAQTMAATLEWIKRKIDVYGDVSLEPGYQCYPELKQKVIDPKPRLIISVLRKGCREDEFSEVIIPLSKIDPKFIVISKGVRPGDRNGFLTLNSFDKSKIIEIRSAGKSEFRHNFTFVLEDEIIAERLRSAITRIVKLSGTDIEPF